MAFKRPRWGVLVVVAALPLQKTAGQSGILQRLTVIDLFTAVVVAGTVVALLRGRGGSWHDLRLPTQFLVGIALFLPIALASFFVTETPERSMVEMIAYVVNLVIVAAIVFHVRTRKHLYACLDAWEWSAVFVTALACLAVVLLFQGNHDTLLTNGPKVTATFKKSGQLSSYMMVTLPILWFNLFYRTRSLRVRWLRSLLFVGAMIALFATGSRTGLAIGGSVALILFLGRWIVGILSRRTMLKLSTLCFAAMIAVPVYGWLLDQLPFTFQRALSVVYLSAEEDSSLKTLSPTRHYQMVGFRTAAAKYPLTGVGVGDFYTRNTALAPGAWESHEIHNTYLGVWAETGVLGIFALLLFYLGVAQALWQAISHAPDPEIAALGVALGVGMLAFWIYGTSHFSLRMRSMWAIFALALALWNVVARERRTPAPVELAA